MSDDYTKVLAAKYFFILGFVVNLSREYRRNEQFQTEILEALRYLERLEE